MVDRLRRGLARNDLVGKGSHHHLLAHHPVEIAARQVVALTHEAERLRTVESLPTDGEVRRPKAVRSPRLSRHTRHRRGHR